MTKSYIHVFYLMYTRVFFLKYYSVWQSVLVYYCDFAMFCYIAKAVGQKDDEKKPKKAAKTLKVLDPKAGQNLCKYACTCCLLVAASWLIMCYKLTTSASDVSYGFPTQLMLPMPMYDSELAPHHSCCRSSKQDGSVSLGMWHG